MKWETIRCKGFTPRKCVSVCAYGDDEIVISGGLSHRTWLSEIMIFDAEKLSVTKIDDADFKFNS